MTKSSKSRKAPASPAPVIDSVAIASDASTSSNNEETDLNNMSKIELIQMVVELKKIVDLKDFQADTEKRMNDIERRQNLAEQYSRRDSIEITGIPKNINVKDIEGEVIKLYELSEIQVDNKKLSKGNIQACHRIGKKGEKVIVKFTNRKFASEALFNGKKIKGKSPYVSEIFFNNSLCREFHFLHYAVRNAKKLKKIHFYKIRHGVASIQLKENGTFHDISHISDLEKFEITPPVEEKV